MNNGMSRWEYFSLKLHRQYPFSKCCGKLECQILLCCYAQNLLANDITNDITGVMMPACCFTKSLIAFLKDETKEISLSGVFVLLNFVDRINCLVANNRLWNWGYFAWTQTAQGHKSTAKQHVHNETYKQIMLIILCPFSITPLIYIFKLSTVYKSKWNKEIMCT